MRWEKLPQSGDVPKARSSHSIALIDDTVYVFGGENQPRVPLPNDLYSYDLSTKTWTKVATKGTPPCARVGHTSAAIGKKIYVFGGRCAKEVGEGSLNDLNIFDTETKTWSLLESFSGTPPPPRSFHAMTAGKEKLYVFGGCGEDGRLNDVHEFNVGSSTWTERPPSDAVTPRGGAGVVYNEADGHRRLYVVGGFCGKELGDVHWLDLDDNVWHEGGDVAAAGLPGGRSVFGIVNVNDKDIVLFGGEVDPSEIGHDGAGSFTNRLFALDAGNVDMGWEEKTPEGDVPEKIGWFATCGGSQGMIVHGGHNAGNVRLGDMYCLSCES